MSPIEYIGKTEARDLIERYVEENSELGFIIDPVSFADHCIGTGRIAYETANKIVEKHPSMENKINPDVLRVSGYMHDFGKIPEGNHYHEIVTAHLIVTKGDSEFGLIQGGSDSERKELLKRMVIGILSDYSLHEELGGEDYPKGVLYPDEFKRVEERFEFLRGYLSETEKPLSAEELTLPLSLEQQVALYADLVNVEGKKISVKERVEEMERRYNDPESHYYDPIFASTIPRAKPRFLIVESMIKSLLRN